MDRKQVALQDHAAQDPRAISPSEVYTLCIRHIIYIFIYLFIYLFIEDIYPDMTDMIINYILYVRYIMYILGDIEDNTYI